MKNILLIFALSFFLAPSAEAQNFDSAVGLRLGVPLSASYKKFVNDAMAFEVYGGIRSSNTYSSVNASGALQFHQDLGAVDNLQWYYGAGVGVFFWNFKSTFVPVENDGTSVAIQGYLGLCYTFDAAPVNVSVDWVPSFFVNGFGNGFGGGYGALAVRYVLD